MRSLRRAIVEVIKIVRFVGGVTRSKKKVSKGTPVSVKVVIHEGPLLFVGEGFSKCEYYGESSKHSTEDFQAALMADRMLRHHFFRNHNHFGSAGVKLVKSVEVHPNYVAIALSPFSKAGEKEVKDFLHMEAQRQIKRIRRDAPAEMERNLLVVDPHVHNGEIDGFSIREVPDINFPVKVSDVL